MFNWIHFRGDNTPLDPVGSKTKGATAAPIAPFATGSTMASGGNPVVSSPPPTAPPRGDHRAEVAQSVEHATENRGVASSILALGTIVSAVVASSSGSGSVGRASPCQGEGRGFESRLPLHFSARQRPVAARGQGSLPLRLVVGQRTLDP